MDAELAEILAQWTEGAWRSTRLWVLLSRNEAPNVAVAQKHLIEALALPAGAKEVWDSLLDSGEFLAAERLIDCADFLAEFGWAAERLRAQLDQVRNKRLEQVRETCWLTQRRALAVGLKSIAASTEAVLARAEQSVPLALQELRRVEVSVESAEAGAFARIAPGPVRQLKAWPFAETPARTVLGWIHEDSTAPTDFRAWLPEPGETGAEHLVSALWWMWNPKPKASPEIAERFGLAMVQFLGYDLPEVHVSQNEWSVCVGLPDLAPAWLPALGSRSDPRRLDIYIATGESVPPPASDDEGGAALLFDPFGVLEKIPPGWIELNTHLLFQLMKESPEVRADVLLAAWGSQINLDEIVPRAPVEPGAEQGPWPEVALANQFLSHASATSRATLDQCRRFLQRYFKYQGIRWEAPGDLDRIVLYSAAHPPLLMKFVRLLLRRTSRRGPSQPVRVGVASIEEARASAEWRNAVYKVLLDPLKDNRIARAILECFVTELEVQGRLISLEGKIQVSRDEAYAYVSACLEPEQLDGHAFEDSIASIERLNLMVLDESSPALLEMTIPIAALLAASIHGPG